MLQNIKVDGKTVYYSEILRQQDFRVLYQQENFIATFETIVTTNTARAFVTYPARARKHFGFNVGDLIVLRATKGDKQFQFLSLVYRWGKLHIPADVVRSLQLQNHELVSFAVICKNVK